MPFCAINSVSSGSKYRHSLTPVVGLLLQACRLYDYVFIIIYRSINSIGFCKCELLLLLQCCVAVVTHLIAAVDGAHLTEDVAQFSRLCFVE